RTTIERRSAVRRDNGRRPAAGGSTGDACVRGEMSPVVAPVCRLVETEAGFGVTRAVRLTRTDKQRIARWIARVERDRADRVSAKAARHEGPVRRCSEAVISPPDAAAGRSNVETALRLRAARCNRKRRRAT